MLARGDPATTPFICDLQEPIIHEVLVIGRDEGYSFHGTEEYS
jgi:hypothetical protein